MAASIYTEKYVEPDDRMLAHDLAEAKEYFDKIGLFIKNEYGEVSLQWKYYNSKTGWILKLLNKKRNVLFVVPCDKYFGVAFTFGERAANLVYASNLPESLKNELFNAKKYAEGRTILVDVKNENDVEDVLTMIRIKLSC